MIPFGATLGVEVGLGYHCTVDPLFDWIGFDKTST